MELNLACSTLRTALRTIFRITFRATFRAAFRTPFRTSFRKLSVPSLGVLPQICWEEDRAEVETCHVRVTCNAFWSGNSVIISRSLHIHCTCTTQWQ
ncbi:hypothetical protein N7522_004025 [Penicillium canescens]|nr:hypothetical protein N7522_004025 [Penicillium canescens]